MRGKAGRKTSDLTVARVRLDARRIRKISVQCQAERTTAAPVGSWNSSFIRSDGRALEKKGYVTRGLNTNRRALPDTCRGDLHLDADRLPSIDQLNHSGERRQRWAEIDGEVSIVAAWTGIPRR